MSEKPTGNVYHLFPEQEKPSLPAEQAAVPPLDTSSETSQEDIAPEAVLVEGDPDGLIPPELLGVTTPTPVENASPYFSADEVQARARRSHPSQGNIPPA